MAGLLRRLGLLSAGLTTLQVAACSHGAPAVESSSAASATSLVAPAPPAPLPPRTVKWVDLKVGDCIVEVPAVDLGAVTATIVDCATAHQAEVFVLTPIAVNAAVTDVANDGVRGPADAVLGPTRRRLHRDLPVRFASGSDAAQPAAEHHHLSFGVGRR